MILLKRDALIYARRITAAFLVVAFMGILAGCPSMMTSSQVQQVNKFAVTAEAYGPLPGDVVRFYADLKWNVALVDASTMTPKKCVGFFADKKKSKDDWYAKAARADKALSILNTYASLLKTLTASDYTEALTEEAETFGKNIDAGIDEYNKLFGASVSGFGAVVAAGVRAVGGTYIRYKQGKALKVAVEAANDSVNKLLDQTMVLVKPFEAPDSRFAFVRKDLDAALLSLAQALYPADQPIPVETLEWFDGQYQLANKGEKLAGRAYKAAESYKAAHDKLVKAIDDKEGLAEIIGRVEVFASEVKAAIALKNEMEK